MPLLALKVDVDTLARHPRRRAAARRPLPPPRRRRDVPVEPGARPHGARDQARISPRLLRQGQAHQRGVALRRAHAAQRHAAAGPRHRRARRAHHARRARPGLRMRHPLLRSRALAGWRDASRCALDGARNGQGGGTLPRSVRRAAANPWRRGLADERARAAPHPVARLRLLLRRPRARAAPAGVERRADPLPAIADDAAHARRADRARRRHRRQRRRAPARAHVRRHVRIRCSRCTPSSRA